MIDLAYLRHLDRFSLIINKRITSNYVGERKTNIVGAGLVFRDHSPYGPGDDFRSIDWKVFGRTDRLYVKRYEAERNLTVHIVLDYSASMHFASGKTTKGEYSAMLGIGYAYMAMKNNERFVLSTFSDKLELFKAKKGRKQLAGIVSYLNDKKPSGKTDLEAAMARYKKLINTSSMIIVISDFLYPPEEIRNVLQRLRKHKVVLIQVLDKQELDLQGLDGDYKLKDSESPDTMRTYISPFLKKQYINKLSVHNDRIKKVSEECGAHFFTFSSDIPVFDAFYDMMGRRTERVSHEH
jgi:uncharacterized protein (DUF58 family)